MPKLRPWVVETKSVLRFVTGVTAWKDYIIPSAKRDFSRAWNYIKWNIIFEPEVKRRVSWHNYSWFPPDIVEKGVPVFDYEGFTRPNIKFPYWWSLYERDTATIHSVWHGNQDKDWGVSTFLIDRRMHDPGYGSPGGTTEDDRRGGLGVNTYFDGFPGIGEGKVIHKYNHLEACYADSGGYWTRTFISVQMPEEPIDASEIEDVFLVIEPMRVSMGEAGNYRKPINFLCLSTALKNYDENYVDWDEPKAGVVWDSLVAAGGGYKKQGDNFGTVLVGAEKFVSNYELITGTTPNRFRVMADPVRDRWWDKSAYSYNLEREVLSLGTVMFKLDLDWGDHEQFLLHWKNEGNTSGEQSEEDIEGGTWTRFSTMSTFNYYDFKHFNPFGDGITYPPDPRTLGGPQRWTAYPTLRKPHLIIRYKKKNLADLEEFGTSITAMGTVVPFKDEGYERNVISDIIRGVPKDFHPLETVDYLRIAPMQDTFEVWKLPQNLGGGGYSVYEVPQYITEKGNKHYFMPRLSFDDSILRQVPFGEEMEGTHDAIGMGPLVGDNRYHRGMKICGIRTEYANPSSTATFNIEVLGEWSDKSGEVAFGVGIINPISDYNIWPAVGPSNVAGTGTLDYIRKIWAISVSPNALEYPVMICPYLDMEQLWLFSPPDYGGNYWMIAGIGDSEFYNIPAGEICGVPIANTFNANKLPFHLRRVFGATDFIPSAYSLLPGLATKSKYFLSLGPLSFRSRIGAGTGNLFDTPLKLPLLGKSMIYVVPGGVLGTVMTRRLGLSDASFENWGSSVSTFNDKNPALPTSITEYSLELVHQYIQTELGQGMEVFTSLPITEINSVTVVPRKGMFPSGAADPGAEFDLLITMSDMSPMPDYVRVEWNALSGTSAMEYHEFSPDTFDGNVVRVGPMSFTSYVSDTGDDYKLRVYTSAGNGPDSLYLVPHTDFHIKKSDALCSSDIIAWPLDITDGGTLSARAVGVVCPHQNRYYPTPSGAFSKKYSWKLYHKKPSTGYVLIDTSVTDDPFYNYTLATPPGGWDVGDILRVTLDVFFNLRDGTSAPYPYVQAPTSQFELTIADDPAASSLFGYKHIGPPEIQGAIQSFDFTILRDVQASVSDTGSVLYSDSGFAPSNCTINGTSHDRYAGDDIEYLRGLVEEGNMVYWERTEGTCGHEKAIRYVGKAMGITENREAPNSVNWSVIVAGVRRIVLP